MTLKGKSWALELGHARKAKVGNEVHVEGDEDRQHHNRHHVLPEDERRHLLLVVPMHRGNRLDVDGRGRGVLDEQHEHKHRVERGPPSQLCTAQNHRGAEHWDEQHAGAHHSSNGHLVDLCLARAPAERQLSFFPQIAFCMQLSATST